MQFDTFYSSIQHAQLVERVVEVLPIILRYVHRGRNAWYATWVEHYFDGCMHDALESAKAYAEAKRGPGNVFYIQEIPGLAFVGSSQCGVVTEINTGCALIDFESCLMAPDRKLPSVVRRERIPISQASASKVQFDSERALSSRGLTIANALEEFASDSICWTRRPPRKHSVVRVWQSRHKLTLEPYFDDPLKIFTSTAVGSRYLLQWSEKAQPKSRSAVSRLADEMDGVVRVDEHC